MKKIKVLVVDDSAVVRQILSNGLSKDPAIEVIGKAADPYIARDKIVYLEPDVVTLDIEMPRMNGIDFLKKLMPQYPVAVVMVSSLTEKGSKMTFEALDAGAVDYVPKPSALTGNGLDSMIEQLIEKIKLAAEVDVSKWKNIIKKKPVVKAGHDTAQCSNIYDMIAVGASTGGTVALRQLLYKLPSNLPGIVVVQHMPPVFTKHFADSLNKEMALSVKEAQDGDRVQSGFVYIAPGDQHIEVKKKKSGVFITFVEKEKVNGHRPSVDVLFNSVAKEIKGAALGILLTGMGSDGARGLLEMKNNGAQTIAQDEESSAVYGMPREAFKMGAVEKVAHIDNMAEVLLTMLERGIK